MHREYLCLAQSKYYNIALLILYHAWEQDMMQDTAEKNRKFHMECQNSLICYLPVSLRGVGDFVMHSIQMRNKQRLRQSIIGERFRIKMFGTSILFLFLTYRFYVKWWLRTVFVTWWLSNSNQKNCPWEYSNIISSRQWLSVFSTFFAHLPAAVPKLKGRMICKFGSDTSAR